MNFFSPFSPPGNPPVKPNSSFSNPSSDTSRSAVFSSDDGFVSVGDSSFEIGFLSSFSRPASPLRRPRPPRISKRLNLAVVTLLSGYLGNGRLDFWVKFFWPRNRDLFRRGLWRWKEAAMIVCQLGERERGESEKNCR